MLAYKIWWAVLFLSGIVLIAYATNL